jgi:alpha-tubulin suppressor-like RCC1 family protein
MLGNGFLWDNDRPGIINELKEVLQISAGGRYSMALRGYKGTREVLGWGYNGYGELGLNNTDIKIYPTKVSAFNIAKVVSVSCGDRHVVVVRINFFCLFLLSNLYFILLYYNY